ncbi:MAG TPA: hypothetical protein DCE41_30400 [Cytophagales bacterium]|nr:hypothetical protein [Cytophagales bacterium]HAA19115.1 hypothetical protein [Cytophagales bacterium]HAP62726.1 hypothetical protein [Cytophagales bacterium]
MEREFLALNTLKPKGLLSTLVQTFPQNLMKKVLYLSLFMVLLSTASKAQFLVTGGIDLIKSDFNGVGQKIQLGTDLNYFVAKKFSVSAGFEFWTAGSPSVTVGARFYPIRPVFIRMRGLIGENDVAFGLGYGLGLTDRIRLEVMGDYYLIDSEAALRVGLAYRFGR